MRELRYRHTLALCSPRIRSIHHHARNHLAACEVLAYHQTSPLRMPRCRSRSAGSEARRKSTKAAETGDRRYVTSTCRNNIGIAGAGCCARGCSGCRTPRRKPGGFLQILGASGKVSPLLPPMTSPVSWSTVHDPIILSTKRKAGASGERSGERLAKSAVSRTN